MGKRIEQTDIAKGIGIILVVIGHAFPDSNKLVSGTFSYYLYQLIYSFHMPFFFFVSGIVSAGIVRYLSGREKIEQIKKKAMRLLVPYFVFGAIFIPLRILFAKYARFSYDFSKLYTIFLGNNPCGQLWFLYVLFFFSLTAILFATKKNIKYLTVCAFVVTCLSSFATLRYDGISYSNSLFMMFFYYLGLYVSQYHDKLYKFMSAKMLALAVPVFVLSFWLFMRYDRYYLLKIMTSLSGICILLCVSDILGKYGVSWIKGALKEIGSYSMDVYIFHSPMGIFWRILLLKILGVSDIVYTLVYIVSGVFGSYLISRFIVRKVPLFRLFFLGMPFKEKKTAVLSQKNKGIT